MACGCGKKRAENSPPVPIPAQVLKVPTELNLTPELLKLKKEVSDSFDQNGGKENIMQMEPDQMKANMLVECYKNAFFYGLVYKKFENDPKNVAPFDIIIFKNKELFPCEEMALNAFNDAIGEILL